jgi:hypothetical protein
MSPSPTDVYSDLLIVIYNALAQQVDFILSIGGNDTFSEQDCIAFGDERLLVGLLFCLAKS